MSSPEEKKSIEPSVMSLTLLPDDLLWNCLARVSRLYHPILSLVSKTFPSLLASPELYKARSLLGRTEICLYVCIDSNSGPSWYTLCRKPEKTLTNDDTSKSKNKKSSGYVLAKVPIPDSPPPYGWGLVMVGSSIYNIGGSEFESSNVSILDCMSHRWTPSLPVEIWPLSTCVLDDKIYVAGYYEDKDGSLKKSCKVLDTKTQIWDPIPIPPMVTKDNFFNNIACADGKLHVKTTEGSVLVYNSAKRRWSFTFPGGWMNEYEDLEQTYCVIENVLYDIYSYNGCLRWYDTEVGQWKKLKGFVGLRHLRDFHPHQSCARLVDYGGKLLVLWETDFSDGGDYKKIWCAVIELEKERCYSSHNIWGHVEWFGHVLTVPNLSKLVRALTPTV